MNKHTYKCISIKSMAFQSFFTSIESTFSSFLDEVIDKKKEWKTKEDLVALFHKASGCVGTVGTDGTVSSSVTISKQPTTKAVSTVSTSVSYEKCIFIITRGDKMGEKCCSRVKPGTQFCVKHYKPSKEEEKNEDAQKDVKKEDKKKKEDEQDEKKPFQDDSKTISLEMKFKKQEELPAKIAEYGSHGKYRIVKNTKVVVNEKNDIIGYLNKSVLVHGSNKEVDSVSKEYKLNINKVDWPSDHIDE
jgi:hypothetical protein